MKSFNEQYEDVKKFFKEKGHYAIVTPPKIDLSCEIDNIDSEAVQFIEDELKYGKLTDDLFDDIMKTLLKLSANTKYDQDASEDELNDFVRDLLSSCGYDIKDQTRQGYSANSNSKRKRSGELDLLMCKDGIPIAIYEALKISNVNKSIIVAHIEKTIKNYNSQGIKNTFVVIYYPKDIKFGEFWNGVVTCVKGLKNKIGGYDIAWENEYLSDASAFKSISGKYRSDNQEHTINLMAIRVTNAQW